MLRHRHDESQVLIVRSGRLGGRRSTTSDRYLCVSAPTTRCRCPPERGASIVNVSADPEAEIIVINGGDGRTRLEWADDVVVRGAVRRASVSTPTAISPRGR